MENTVQHNTIESALPEGYTERTKGRGLITGSWVQQQHVLQHPSIGCFVTHCGAGSVTEALVSNCQLVLLPQATDQFINARMLSLDLQVGLEVEKDEFGNFSKQQVCEAIKVMMDGENQVGRNARVNHEQWMNLLLDEGFQESYISDFITSLKAIALS